MVTQITDNCGDIAVNVLNSGGKKQCVPKPVDSLVMAKEDFRFDDYDAAKLQTNWDTALEKKDIIPLYLIEEFEANNTEEQVYEGRHRDYQTDPAVKGVNYNHIIGDCSYEVLKSLRNSGYTRVFRVTSDGSFMAQIMPDGKVAGEPISSYSVGILNDSEIGGKPQNADITIKFKDYTKSTITPDFDLKNYEGIYEVVFVQVSATASSIKFKAVTDCGTMAITNLEDADVKLLDAQGNPESGTFVVADADGVYEYTGTGFASGLQITTDGVVDKTDIYYENTNPLIIEV